MDSPVTDRRILRTKDMVREAFCALIKKKPAGEITVTELCEKAGINRNTFYSHYSSPSSVLEEMEKDIMARMKLSLTDATASLEIIVTVCRILKEEKAVCRILLSENAGSGFMDRVIKLSEERSKRVMAHKNNPLSKEYQSLMTSFVIFGSSAVIREWATSGMKESPEDIANFILQICDHGTAPLSNDPPACYR